MKRLKSLMLLLVLIPCMLLFTACGGNDKNNNVNNNGNNNGNNGGGNPSLNYTVTFMVNDTVYDTKQVSSGGKVENPTTDPTQNDKIFVGWYNGETAWNFASDVVTKDITLTAKFLGEFDEDNFKVIATKEQLIAYASNVENYEVNARLYADIDLGGMEWTPIGDMDNGEFYMAIFDGNGHTISNYTITKEVKVDEENLTVGFFTALDDGAIVHNLHLKNYTINVNDNVEEETEYEMVCIGGLVAGNFENTEIANCSAEGIINLTLSKNEFYEGFVIGGLIGFIVEANINNCYSNNNINVEVEDVESDSVVVGGLVGDFESATIANCYSMGDINVKNCPGACVGGFAGRLTYNSYADNCYSTCNVKVDSENVEYETLGVGGFVGGVSYSVLNNCYYAGDIEVSLNSSLEESEAYLGKFAGHYIDNLMKNCFACNGQQFVVKNSTEYELCEEESKAGMQAILASVVENWDSTIWNIYSDKNPTLKKDNAKVIDINSKEDLLKLSGKTLYFKEIKLNIDINLDGEDFESLTLIGSTFNGNGYNILNIKIVEETEDDKVPEIETFDSVADVGQVARPSINEDKPKTDLGFIGKAVNSKISNLAIENIYIDFEYNRGFTSSSDDVNVGGLVANLVNSTISNCYSTGSVKATGLAQGDSPSVGGLVGYSSSSTIENCYSTAVVESASMFDGYSYAGGLVGYSSETTIKNCFATGNVTAIAEKGYMSSYSYVGGLVGCLNSSSKVENCYKNSEQVITGTGISNQICEAGTSADMQTIWNFVKTNWDKEVWNLYTDKNPNLK